MAIDRCPICSRNRDDDKLREEFESLLVKHGCVSAAHNPGGAEFSFKELGKLQISAECDACDLDRLKLFLAEK